MLGSNFCKPLPEYATTMKEGAKYVDMSIIGGGSPYSSKWLTQISTSQIWGFNDDDRLMGFILSNKDAGL
jgi:hypothetical protein